MLFEFPRAAEEVSCLRKLDLRFLEGKWLPRIPLKKRGLPIARSIPEVEIPSAAATVHHFERHQRKQARSAGTTDKPPSRISKLTGALNGAYRTVMNIRSTGSRQQSLAELRI